MTSRKLSREVIVACSVGMGLRASYSVVTLARQFDCRIRIVTPTGRADATDLFQVLALGGSQGTHLTLEAEGEQAEAALSALEKLFAENCGLSD